MVKRQSRPRRKTGHKTGQTMDKSEREYSRYYGSQVEHERNPIKNRKVDFRNLSEKNKPQEDTRTVAKRMAEKRRERIREIQASHEKKDKD